jgi:hypothetical protein
MNKKNYSWIGIAIKIILTGGVWLVWRVVILALPTYERAWLLRSRYITADPDCKPSPWLWIRHNWLATVIGLVAIEFWTIVYLSLASLAFPAAFAINEAGSLSPVALLMALPSLIAHVAWAGSVVILTVHTAWPDRLLALLEDHRQRFSKRAGYGTRDSSKTQCH